MPRPRSACESGIYHVTQRGNGRQLIFEDDADRSRFLSAMARSREKSPVEIHAYCLMENHVHLLVRDAEEKLSAFMHRLLTAYAMYFNLRHDRVGSLFQGRYRSEPVETDEQYLATLRYVLQNPARAGLAPVDAYRWSSYQDYERGEGLTDRTFAIELLGGSAALIGFVRDAVPGVEADDVAERHVGRARRSDGAARVSGLLSSEGISAADLKTWARPERDAALAWLLSRGCSIRAVERATGISRGIVQRISRQQS